MPSSPPQPIRPWRALMWLAVVLAAAGIWSLIGASRGGTSSEVLSGIGLFIGGIGLAGWFGIRGAREEARARASEAGRTVQVMLVAELGRHDDDTLHRIAARPGPAAEAARMILQGRHLGNPAGRPRRPPSET